MNDCLMLEHDVFEVERFSADVTLVLRFLLVDSFNVTFQFRRVFELSSTLLALSRIIVDRERLP